MKSSPHLHVFKQRVAAASDAADEYKLDLYELMGYAAQVKAYQLPVLNNPNQWPGGATAYQQTLATWANVVGQLQGWAMGTLQNVMVLPQTLVQLGTQVVTPTLNQALSDCQLLIQQPTNQQAQTNMMTDLQLVSSDFNQFSAMTAPLITSLQGQATIFNQDAQIMQTIASEALQTAGSDQQLVDSLNVLLQDLQANLKDTERKLVKSCIKTVVGIAMAGAGVVSIIFTEGGSIMLVISGLVMTTLGVIGIILDTTQLIEDQNQINQLTQQINSYDYDIVLLQAMAGTVGQFASEVNTLQGALTVVTAPWVAAEQYFTDTLNALSTIENATSEDWQQVYSELEDICTGWNQLMAVMQQLQVSAQFSSAQLSIGMTQAEVEQAMQAAPSTGLVEYLMAA